MNNEFIKTEVIKIDEPDLLKHGNFNVCTGIKIDVVKTMDYGEGANQETGYIGVVYTRTKYFRTKDRYGFDFAPCFTTDEIRRQSMVSFTHDPLVRKLYLECLAWITENLK